MEEDIEDLDENKLERDPSLGNFRSEPDLFDPYLEERFSLAPILSVAKDNTEVETQNDDTVTHQTGFTAVPAPILAPPPPQKLKRR